VYTLYKYNDEHHHRPNDRNPDCRDRPLEEASCEPQEGAETEVATRRPGTSQPVQAVCDPTKRRTVPLDNPMVG